MTFASEDLLRSFELRVQEQTERAAQLSARIQQNTISAESPDGEVRVTVDSTGGLADLRFGPSAERVPLDRLAEIVLDTSRRAQGQLARAMSEVVSEVYGAGSATAEFVSSAYAEHFPPPAKPGGGDQR